ncbi:cysteine desulfurase CsdA [Candidatus Marinamargulisbacteria bacterium SCGC AG-410-N11]|nr:cysteine desulfurase CsdA [Candidatus Marinamargulisbacteria bacterium SCGC AG-410-N11]
MVMSINNETIRQYRDQFPVLSQSVNGKPLVYLDNAATSQKPTYVIDRITDFLNNHYATVHRGIYQLSQKSTEKCDRVRTDIKTFINAKRDEEIVFVRGTTEAINLVAHSTLHDATETDEVLVSGMEHHANIVPWQQQSKRTGCRLVVSKILDNGDIDLDDFLAKINANTKVVSVCHVSNILGTINPIEAIIKAAKEVGAYVLIDGAQAPAHFEVDVQALGCDFYCFSGHKMYGPTGIGVLYGRYDVLDQLPPYQTGGDMIETVTWDKTTYAKPPLKFEAGTPSITEIIGLGAALEFIKQVGFDLIKKQEALLLEYSTQQLSQLKSCRLIGTATHKKAINSFVLEDIHPHDVGTILDEEGVAVRVGHHCSQPLMKRFDVPATIRASYNFTNTTDDVDRLIQALNKAIEVMT